MAKYTVMYEVDAIKHEPEFPEKGDNLEITETADGFKFELYDEDGILIKEVCMEPDDIVSLVFDNNIG